MELQNVLEKVKDCMVDSCDVERDEIALNKSLIRDLQVDSIDLIDLLYNLEKSYGISLEIGEFENVAKKEMNGTAFSVDNVITEDGLGVLKRLMPEVPMDKFKKGMTVHEIPYLFTVESLCSLVMKKVRARGNA